MKKSTVLNLALAGCVIGLLAGCASTKVTSQERLVSERLPKPNQIVVYDFGDEPAEIAADSALASQASAPVTPPSVEQLALGRRLGSSIADDQFVEQDSLDAAEVRIVEGYYDLDSGKVEWKTE